VIDGKDFPSRSPPTPILSHYKQFVESFDSDDGRLKDLLSELAQNERLLPRGTEWSEDSHRLLYDPAGPQPFVRTDGIRPARGTQRPPKYSW
jgi:hypothetical protein